LINGLFVKNNVKILNEICILLGENTWIQ